MRDQHKCKITFRPQTAVWTTFSQWSVIDIFVRFTLEQNYKMVSWQSDIQTAVSEVGALAAYLLINFTVLSELP